jgi:hypothetical protein
MFLPLAWSVASNHDVTLGLPWSWNNPVIDWKEMSMTLGTTNIHCSVSSSTDESNSQFGRIDVHWKDICPKKRMGR